MEKIITDIAGVLLPADFSKTLEKYKDQLMAMEEGRLKVDFFKDVPKALKMWKKNYSEIYTFSRGDEKTQRAIFCVARKGDLSPYITGYFDDSMGPKTDPDSFKRISDELKTDPKKLYYLDDELSFIETASLAGLEVCLVDRLKRYAPQDFSYKIVRDCLEA